MTSTLTQLCLSYVANRLDDYADILCHLPEELATLVIHHLVTRKSLTDSHLLQLLSTPVTHLDISGSTQLSLDTISQIPVRCPNLRELDLSLIPDLDDDVVIDILYEGKNLRSLVIEGEHITDRAFDGAGDPDRVPECQHLSSLRLRCSNVSPEGISRLGLFCPHLETVAMNTGKVRGLYTLPSLFDRCSKLTRLSLERLELNDEIVSEHLCSHDGARNLQYLSLAGNEHISDASLVSISQAMPRLARVKLVNCLRISGPGLITLMKDCHSLVGLNIKGVYQMSYTALKEVILSYASRLVSLNLGECEQVDDRLMILLAERGAHLQSLRLDWCELVTDTSVSVLVRSLPRLRKLSIRKCNTGEESILAIGHHCPNLEYLDISRGGQGDTASCESLIMLARGCPQLSTLLMQWMLAVDDNVMQMFWRHCPNLTTVDLEGCKALTSEGMPMVAVPKLRSLSLTWCNDVDDSALLDLSARAPKLEIKNYYGNVIDANMVG